MNVAEVATLDAQVRTCAACIRYSWCNHSNPSLRNIASADIRSNKAVFVPRIKQKIRRSVALHNTHVKVFKSVGIIQDRHSVGLPVDASV